MKTKHSTREEWLTEAIKRMEPWMKAAGGGATPKVRVSVGWPLGGRATPKKEGDNYRIGECFAPAVSKDGTSEIFISPLLADPPLVLATLAHELVHSENSFAKNDFLVYNGVEVRGSFLRGDSDAWFPLRRLFSPRHS